MNLTLSNGMKVFFDAIDYDLVKKHKWYAFKAPNGVWYCRAFDKSQYKKEGRKQKAITMHRLIMGETDRKILIDHKDHDGLNNCRDNLRRCTQSQNQMNRKGAAKGSSSKYLGVSKRVHKNMTSYSVSIRINGKMKRLGSFINEKDAAEVYNKAAAEYFGEFASFNDTSK